jgi:hypothetical protein
MFAPPECAFLTCCSGEYQLKWPPPFVSGMETAGVVPARRLHRVSVRVNGFDNPVGNSVQRQMSLVLAVGLGVRGVLENRCRRGGLCSADRAASKTIMGQPT